MTDHIPIPPRPNPLSPTAQFMLNAAFHQHQQHGHLNPTPDLRALSQELLQYARDAQNILIGEGLWDVDDDEGLFDRADKALATPLPEPPTDEELDELSWNWYSKTGSTWWQIDSYRAFARAVLERWGK